MWVNMNFAPPLHVLSSAPVLPLLPAGIQIVLETHLNTHFLLHFYQCCLLYFKKTDQKVRQTEYFSCILSNRIYKVIVDFVLIIADQNTILSNTILLNCAYKQLCFSCHPLLPCPLRVLCCALRENSDIL